ncbi:hypothetical protein [Neobacillus niacini]|uniref:hypothetical protein n=1 Tax=Neobacillus niacini TaxID=86668 RepID=UPI0005F0720B|nr:hypothetical protein [Neobacillus niacini]
MAVDYTRNGIRIALELWLSTENDFVVEELLDLLIHTGLFDNTDQVISIIETEEAHVLLPFIVKLLRRQLNELKDEMGNDES